MSEPVIRDVDPKRDAAACAAIYAPSVLVGPTSFEEVAPDEDEMATRITRLTITHPWLVAEQKGVQLDLKPEMANEPPEPLLPGAT
jgi:L-amino acid N-acyltransferase YncA